MLNVSKFSDFIDGFTGDEKQTDEYALVNVYSLLLKMAMDIVDLLSSKMVIFHSYVSLPKGKPPFSYGFPRFFRG